MKKIITAALLSLAAFTFIAGTVSVSGGDAAFARDDGAGHDANDDHGGGRGRGK